MIKKRYPLVSPDFSKPNVAGKDNRALMILTRGDFDKIYLIGTGTT